MGEGIVNTKFVKNVLKRKVEPTGVVSKFPIEMNQVIYGKEYKKQLNKGDIVHCWWCGSDVVVDEKSAFVCYETDYITCPICKRHVNVFYYMGKVVGKMPDGYDKEDKKEDKKNEENKSVDKNEQT